MSATLTFGLLFPFGLHASVALDSGNKYTACVTGTSCSYTFVNTAGNAVVINNTSFGNTGANPGTVTMSYNGVSLTQMHTQLNGDQGGAAGKCWTDTFQSTAAVSIGSHTIAISETNSNNNGFYAHAISFSGANPTAPVEGIHAFQSTTTSQQWMSVVTAVDNAVPMWNLTGCGGRVYTPDSLTTRVTSGWDDAQTYEFRRTSTTVSPTGTYSLTATNGSAETAGDVGYAIDPPGTASTIKIIQQDDF